MHRIVAGLFLLSLGACVTSSGSKPATAPVIEDERAVSPSINESPGGETAELQPEEVPPEVIADTPPAAEADPAETIEEASSTQEDADEAGDVVGEPEQEVLKISNNPTARKDFKDAVVVATADPARAMALFERSAREDSTFVLAWHNAGAAAERQQKWAKAAGYYKKAIEHQVDFFPSLYGLVQVQARLGQAAQARTALQRALASKRNQKTLAAAGAAALVARRLDEAEQYAKQSLKQDEKFVPAMQLLADIYFLQKKYELSRFVLRNAREIDPGNALVHLALARAHLKLDNKSAATKDFIKAASLRSDLVEANNNLSVLYYESGDYEAALRASKASVDQAPDMAITWLNYGNALRAGKSYAKAITAYEKARSLKGAPPAADFNLGILYIDNEIEKLDIVQRMDKALAYLESYRTRATLDEEQTERLDKYVTEADRAKSREIKKRERSAKRKAREEKRKKAAEEEKLRAEEEAREKAEQAARLKAEAEARKKSEEEARRKAEDDARSRSLGGGGK